MAPQVTFPRTRRGGWSTRWFLAALGLILGLVAPGGSGAFAQGTNTLEASTPSAEAILDSPPTQIQLRFGAPIGDGVLAEDIGLAVSCASTPLGLGPRQLGPDGRTVLAPVTQIAPNGTCVVSWRLPDASVGTFEFSVRSSSAATLPPVTVETVTEATEGTGPVTTTTVIVDPADTVTNVEVPGGLGLGLARWVSMFAIAALFGMLVLMSLGWPEGIHDLPALKFLRSTYVIALGSTVVVLWLTAAATSDRSAVEALNPVTWSDLFNDGPGRALWVRTVLVALTGTVAFVPDRAVTPRTQLGALGIPALAVASYGFSRSGLESAATVNIAGALHALSAALWIGMLIAVARVVVAKPGGDDLVLAIRSYFRLATPLTVIAVVTGVVTARALDGGSWWEIQHARWTLLKAVLVALLIYLGVIGRRRWRSRLARAEHLDRRTAALLRRSLGAEMVLAIAILGATAGLASSTPARVEAPSPAGSYAYDTTLSAEGFAVRLSITPLVAGPQGLRIEVLEPTTIESLVVRLQPTEVPTAPGWEIDVPLRRAGAATLRVANGWRLDIPGVWSVDIEARGPLGPLPTLSSSIVVADPAED